MLAPETGREIWRTDREERFNWPEPYVVEHDGKRQIVVNGLTVRGYDFETGAPIWEVEGLGENTIPQPLQHEDLVFAMSGHTVKTSWRYGSVLLATSREPTPSPGRRPAALPTLLPLFSTTAVCTF